MSQRGIPPDLEGEYTAQSIFWSLQPDREQAFWDAVTAEVPAPREKIVFQPTTPLPFQQDVDFVCATQGVWAKEFCQRHGWWFNAPAVLGLTVGDIVNPKDTVSKALNSATGILPALWVAEAEIRAFQYNGSGEDVVDAAALPVFMVQEAVEHMRDVVSMGREIEEQEKKLFIATLLMAIFFVIPLLGEGLGALGMGTLGRVFAALGELGDIGQDIYGIVDDPKSAPLAIFGLIAGGAGLLDAVSVRKAAEIRRGMSPDDIAKLGSSLKTKMDQVEQVVNKNAGKKVCIP